MVVVMIMVVVITIIDMLLMITPKHALSGGDMQRLLRRIALQHRRQVLPSGYLSVLYLQAVILNEIAG